MRLAQNQDGEVLSPRLFSTGDTDRAALLSTLAPPPATAPPPCDGSAPLPPHPEPALLTCTPQPWLYNLGASNHGIELFHWWTLLRGIKWLQFFFRINSPNSVSLLLIISFCTSSISLCSVHTQQIFVDIYYVFPRSSLRRVIHTAFI